MIEYKQQIEHESISSVLVVLYALEHAHEQVLFVDEGYEFVAEGELGYDIVLTAVEHTGRYRILRVLVLDASTAHIVELGIDDGLDLGHF